MKEGLRSIKQNRIISFAAIGVLVTCLLLVGASVLFTLNINSLVGYAESQNEVLVYLDDGITSHGAAEIGEKIKALANVSSVEFISRDDGLEDWMESLGDDGTLLEWLQEDNPLQDSYRVVLRDLSDMDGTLEEIEGISGVESVSASQETASAVTALKRSVSFAGTAVIVILIAVSLLIIANTIRLSVFSRRREISIMKYVGATDSFIRLPFLSEGVLIGFISAIIAFLLLWGGYEIFLNRIGGSDFAYADMLANNLIPYSDVALRLLGYFLLAGIGIGGIGSAVAVGKYIHV